MNSRFMGLRCRQSRFSFKGFTYFLIPMDPLQHDLPRPSLPEPFTNEWADLVFGLGERKYRIEQQDAPSQAVPAMEMVAPEAPSSSKKSSKSTTKNS